jgi:hypothetical protein
MSRTEEVTGEIWFPLHHLRDALEAADPAFNVLMLHHPFSWFRPELRRELLALVDSAFDLVFAGHEHLVEGWVRDDLDGSRSLYVEGGVFQEHNKPTGASTFNLLSVEFPSAGALLTSFDHDGERYARSTPKALTFGRQSSKTKTFRILSDKRLA